MLRSVIFWPPSRRKHTSNLVNTAASCPRWPYGTDLKCSPAWTQLAKKMQNCTSSDPQLSSYSYLVPKNLRAHALFLPDDGYLCIPRGAAWEQSNHELRVENLEIKTWREKDELGKNDPPPVLFPRSLLVLWWVQNRPSFLCILCTN